MDWQFIFLFFLNVGLFTWLLKALNEYMKLVTEVLKITEERLSALEKKIRID